MENITRSEYPRPQFERTDWLCLNGKWEFGFFETELYEKVKDFKFSQEINVPFSYLSPLSGINDDQIHDMVWYRKTFSVPKDYLEKRNILHFNAVDYQADVWLNNSYLGSHEGGHTPFSFDVTEHLISEENILVVRAIDFSDDVTLPRGKQYWKNKSQSIFYTNTIGIWQTVWLEPINELHIQKVRFLPNIDKNSVKISTFIQGQLDKNDLSLRCKIYFNGKDVFESHVDELVVDDTYRIFKPVEERFVCLENINHSGFDRWWTPENPNLYSVHFELYSGNELIDDVRSYFGMRKFSIEQGQFCLNNKPYFMRLVLDQGYHPEGVLTYPSEESILKDINLTKEMGFNGVRKHQKVEDPRFLHHCDRQGLLVWGEMANAYDYSIEYAFKMNQEWIKVIERDYNHPCIAAWVPLNESWGIPNVECDDFQVNHALSLYHLTKSIDSSRPVMSNDGWEHMKSDLCTIHDYEWNEEVLEKRYDHLENILDFSPAKRNLYVKGFEYNKEPILVTEMGGIAFAISEQEGWGYSGANSEEDFLSRMAAIIRPLHTSRHVQGFCYTQLTDVELEINGLLTYHREPKADIDLIRKIIMNE